MVPRRLCLECLVLAPYWFCVAAGYWIGDVSVKLLEDGDSVDADPAWRPARDVGCNSDHGQQEQLERAREKLAECVARLILDKLPTTTSAPFVAHNVTVSVRVFEFNNVSLVKIGGQTFGGDGPRKKIPEGTAPGCSTKCDGRSSSALPAGCRVSWGTERSEFRNSEARPAKRLWPEYMARVPSGAAAAAGVQSAAEGPSDKSVDGKNVEKLRIY